MAITHKETTSFEAYQANGDYVIEFRCPQCGEILGAETEMLEGGFDVACDNCNHVIQCYFKLVMDW
jgi:predicted RNA-binding Zn-ribbon protein involved in translation (DUF1610 family)